MTHIGSMRKQVMLQQEQQTPDGAGGYALAWVTVATMWADIAPVSGNEIFAAGHLEGHVTHKITLRFLAGVTADMRVLYGARAFNIRAALNDGERNEHLVLLAEEGGAI